MTANSQALGALQLGPDNKIYLAKENSLYLSAINQPDVIGTGSMYVLESVNLAGRASNLGLPGFVASSLVRSEPYISSFSPISGFVGDTVTITGINFNTNPSNNIVTFNGLAAIVTNASATSLTVIVPNGATTGEISIEVGCGLVSSTDNFTVTALATLEFESASIVLFPNPSAGIFNIKSHQPMPNATIAVTDMHGRIVYQTITDLSESKILDLRSVASGVYILKVSDNEKSYSHKIIRN